MTSSVDSVLVRRSLPDTFSCNAMSLATALCTEDVACTTPEKDSEPILSPLSKRAKLESSSATEKCVIFIVDKKISSGHLAHLKRVAERKGFTIAPCVSDDVTHIVSNLPSFERVLSTLSGHLPEHAQVVCLEWLTTSFVEGKPVQVTDRYRLQKSVPPPVLEASPAQETIFQIPEYECQRATLLKHHNHELTDALELLERYHQHLDHKQGDTRALAYRQASCALKVLPKKVESINEITHLPRIGKHSSQVIEDILTTGSSQEVEDCKASEWFQCMELFTVVYGCGSATADKWYNKGLRSIKDVQSCEGLQLTETQKLGLTYHTHLSLSVTREETEMIVDYIQRQTAVCVPGVRVEAVGGYRRGKPQGHDVDLLLTHPDSVTVDTLLDAVLTRLHKQGVLIHSDVSTGQNTLGHNKPLHAQPTHGKHRRVKFDHLDKAFCILDLPLSTSLDQQGAEPRLIKRVDFIVAPPEQYPFALVSWTGSKQFNRSLKRYSVKELNMTVSAHGVYDIAQGKYLPAATEREVFALLKLEYREPWERNC